MKPLLKISVVVFSLLSSLNASAAMLSGTVTGAGVLGCMMYNFTGQDQILDQVQYQYLCNGMPQFRTAPGFGANIPNGRNYWHTNGPYTSGCMPMAARCMGYTHPAPAAIPMPTAVPTDDQE